MEVQINARPSFAHIKLRLQPGEKIIAEADAMASMSSGVRLVAKFFGGFFAAFMRRLFGGESLFVNEFTTDTPDAELILTQPTPGDIVQVDLRGTSLFIQPGAFIACGEGVSVGLAWAGFASWISREGLFRMRLSGTGPVWIGAYGGIYAREVSSEYIVDTGHLVAYEPTVSLRVGLASGALTSLLSGEGLVARLSGPGKVYLQSRSVSGLVSWTNQYLW